MKSWNTVEAARPRPELALTEMEDDEFVPAPELADWVKGTFLNEQSRLYNPEHGHLLEAHIGYLWTNVPYRKHGMEIAGTAEIPSVQGPTWTKRRMDYQLRRWFGSKPDFVITLDARYAHACSDIRFCALVDHELTHCGQTLDAFGQPKFTDEGLPVFRIRGHDVEEFVSIVRRYGPGNAAGATKALVEAAMQMPEIGEADVAAACGTCLRAA